jgi:hypothetical protein
MKTISFMLITILVLIGLSQTVAAQKNIHMINKNIAKEMFTSDSMEELYKAPRTNDVNIKAIRDFIKLYKNVDNAEWYAVEDGFIAKFQKDGIETKVEYDVTGRRSNILRSYNESHMPFEIRDIVKRQYYDYDILITYEIEHSQGIIYIIKIMDKTSLKVLQITNNEMKVLEDYVRG